MSCSEALCKYCQIEFLHPSVVKQNRCNENRFAIRVIARASLSCRIVALWIETIFRVWYDQATIWYNDILYIALSLYIISVSVVSKVLPKKNPQKIADIFMKKSVIRSLIILYGTFILKIFVHGLHWLCNLIMARKI